LEELEGSTEEGKQGHASQATQMEIVDDRLLSEVDFPVVPEKPTQRQLVDSNRRKQVSVTTTSQTTTRVVHDKEKPTYPSGLQSKKSELDTDDELNKLLDL
jgi:hypothetical protein